MKKYLIIILLICIFILTGCSNTKFNITNTVEYNYMKQNSEHITEFIVKYDGFSAEGPKCYKIDNDKLFDTLNKVKTIKKTNEQVSDGDMYYIIKFDDDTTKTFKFESDILVYNKDRYKVELPILVLTTDIEVPCE